MTKARNLSGEGCLARTVVKLVFRCCIVIATSEIHLKPAITLHDFGVSGNRMLPFEAVALSWSWAHPRFIDFDSHTSPEKAPWE